MTAFTGNSYLVADIATLLAIPAVDRPAFKVALLVSGLGWYEYDNAATTGGLTPDDLPATGRWFSLSDPTQFDGDLIIRSGGGLARLPSTATTTKKYLTQYILGADPLIGNAKLFILPSEGLIDSSPSGNTLSLFGGVSLSSAVLNTGSSSSVFFDGVGDYITTPISPNLNFATSDFTWEAFIYLTDLSFSAGGKILISNSNNTIGFYLSYRGQIRLSNRTSSFLLETSGASILINTWHHVAVTRSAGVVNIWIDGVSRGTSSSFPTTIDQDSIFAVGSQIYNTSSFQDFTGYMSAIRLSDAVRYTATFDPYADTNFTVDTTLVTAWETI